MQTTSLCTPRSAGTDLDRPALTPRFDYVSAALLAHEGISMTLDAPGPRPGLSVVICTRNRADQIGAAVRSVLESAYADLELLVVDQSTDSSTALALSSHRDDPRFRYLHTQTTGLSLAGNIGVRNTRGQFVAFTDDDCIVRPDWAERIVTCLAVDARLGAVFGTVLPAPGFDLQAGWLPIFMPDRSSVLVRARAFPGTGPMGANMAFRRTVLERMHGFDILLGPGAPLKSAGDIDALYRTLLLGYAVAIRTDVTVTHFGFREYSSGSGASILWDSMFANGAFYAKHVRSGDFVATCGFLRELTHLGGSILRHAWVRQRPLGLRMPAMMMRGFFASFGFPIDGEHRLFVDPAAAYQAAPELAAS
jgi:glycosyltransferase involved in cell wall biosynthesis